VLLILDVMLEPTVLIGSESSSLFDKRRTVFVVLTRIPSDGNENGHRFSKPAAQFSRWESELKTSSAEAIAPCALIYFVCRRTGISDGRQDKVRFRIVMGMVE
jgi:hypothetical protein